MGKAVPTCPVCGSPSSSHPAAPQQPPSAPPAPPQAHLHVVSRDVHSRKHFHATAAQVSQPPLVALDAVAAASVRLLLGSKWRTREQLRGSRACRAVFCRALAASGCGHLSSTHWRIHPTPKQPVARTCAVRSGSSPCCLSDWNAGMASAAARSSTLQGQAAAQQHAPHSDQQLQAARGSGPARRFPSRLHSAAAGTLQRHGGSGGMQHCQPTPHLMASPAKKNTPRLASISTPVGACPLLLAACRCRWSAACSPACCSCCSCSSPLLLPPLLACCS